MVDMAIIGMGVMGSSLAYNFAEKGYDVALFNRTDEKTLKVCENAKDEPFAHRLHAVTGEMQDLVNVVGKQGIYFFIIKAGKPTEDMINQLVPLLEPGAVIVDMANSYFKDTIRLSENLKINFFGCGISGGEKGARYGPSLMPGGDLEVYNNRLKQLLEAISAKAPQDSKPCVAYLGKHGAGHFVKMIHNGIEYADMQLIAESYDFMKNALKMSNAEIADVFMKWNSGMLESYLIEITAKVLRQKEPDGSELIDHILDKAKMKGTGTWTILTSLESDVIAVPSIYAAVEARAISFQKEKRLELSRQFNFSAKKVEASLGDLEKALFLAKIAAYAQGIDLLRAGDKEYGFGLDIVAIAEIWRAGCIIRARLLGDITKEYRKNPNLPSLLSAFNQTIVDNMESLRRICVAAANANIPFIAFDSSRNYILQSTIKKLPANLIQAMRDFFGAHTYERIDKKGVFHTDWE